MSDYRQLRLIAFHVDPHHKSECGADETYALHSLDDCLDDIPPVDLGRDPRGAVADR
ncbi:MAG: hypothetical protein ACRYFW_11010 [Janthinobacterium lividum]